MATINESGKLIGLTTSSGVVYVPSSQIASFKAGGAGTIVQTLIKGKPDTLNCVESVSDIAAQGNFFPVTLVSGGTLYLNSNRVSYIEATGSGSTILYEPVNVFDKATVTESPAAVKTLMDDLVGSPGLLKTQRFVWDSTIDGNITDPTTTFTLGSFGTAGKRIGSVRCRAYTQNVVTGFSDPFSAGFAIQEPTGTYIWFLYLGDNSQDPLTTDGWQVPVSGLDNAQVDTTDLGVGPISVEIAMSVGLGTWDMSGRIEVIMEWVESV